ncbi:MAG: tRNA (adenosine(37)-N6)-threonylcarbamoyltransferase complex ATPase subunit type 1 TsaE [Chitinophagaceae bacterium]|nr:MAG: tRNA (adenosine(37)-N6)-threonylcarbamoyltransferase complex ATPase subunit type 1 TsaE [Chitinophagaceae bacterium]
MELIYSLETIAEIATQFWKLNEGVTVFALHGEMGAGKTTLVHALCDAKGVKDVVGSPTFSIINEYAFEEGNGGEKKIFHIDLYRLQDEEEAIRAGVEDCLYSDHICLVEWPERALSIFPDHTAHIYINVVNSGTRRLRIDRN